MEKVIAKLEKTPPGGRNSALNHAAWTLGRWIAAGALEQAEVEDALYTGAVANGLVAWVARAAAGGLPLPEMTVEEATEL